LMLHALKKSKDDINNMKNFNIMIDDINKLLSNYEFFFVIIKNGSLHKNYSTRHRLPFSRL